jgi:hypothetical protein
MIDPVRSDRTTSEKLFEEACRATRICCRRIRVATVQGHRRPDYKVQTPLCGAVVEVKEVAPNEEDLRHRAELATGRVAVMSHTPGARLRRLIRDASKQLGRASKRGVPTAVAIFDTTGSIAYTDPYNVKVAMFGLDAIVIAVPEELTVAPYAVGMKNAGKAVLTEEHNTSVSAVIIIRAFPGAAAQPPVLLVYHNRFARVPFDPAHLRGYVWSQFALGRAQNGATGWMELFAPPTAPV